MNIRARLRAIERRVKPTRQAPNAGTWQEILERAGVPIEELPEAASPAESLALWLGMTSRELIDYLKRRVRGEK